MDILIKTDVKRDITCSSCHIPKPTSDFYKYKRYNGGFVSACKTCYKESGIKYNKTFDGVINRIFDNQKKKSKKRGDKPPNYTKQELGVWIKSQPNFQLLWDNWVKSDYNKWMKPSCDRDNDYKGYCLSRLTLMTWEENNNKAYRDRKNGILNKTSKAVVGTHLKTGEVIKFYSAHEATRQTGIKNVLISRVALGKKQKDGKGNWYTPRSAGGYKWEFKQVLIKPKNKNS